MRRLVCCEMLLVSWGMALVLLPVLLNSPHAYIPPSFGSRSQMSPLLYPVVWTLGKDTKTFFFFFNPRQAEAKTFPLLPSYQ